MVSDSMIVRLTLMPHGQYRHDVIWFDLEKRHISNSAERFAQTLYRFILKGSPAELAVIADELAYSARALVRHATDRGRLKNYRLEREDEKKKNPPKVEGYPANWAEFKPM